MEIPIYIWFPLIIGSSQFISFYVMFRSRGIRKLKTHYFFDEISTEKLDNEEILKALKNLERSERIRKIEETNEVFTFVDDIFYMKSNIYYIPKNSTKIYFRGLYKKYSINKKAKDKVLNELKEEFGK